MTLPGSDVTSEALEAVARAKYETATHHPWDGALPIVQENYRDDARKWLAAAEPFVLARLQTAREQAWDEGYAAAEYMAKCWGHVDWWEKEPTNPYLSAAPTSPETPT